MAARLGNVLYWAANVVALLFLLQGGCFGYVGSVTANSNAAVMSATYILFGLGAWLFGWVCRYVLVGRPAGRTRKCPHCAEFIKPEAIVCMHCGSDVVSSKDTIDDFIKQARKSKHGGSRQAHP